MVVIIGAGITGLCVAWRLKQAGRSFRLLEASSSVGGLIQSRHVHDSLIELGPNSLQLKPALQTLIQSVGLESQIVYPQPQVKNRFLLKNGKLQKLPLNPLQFLTSRFFSFHAKLQLFKELTIPKGRDYFESVDSFFRRRFGDEITDYVVYPFVSGIYAGDPKRMLMRLTFPQLQELEQEFGSVLRGLVKKRTGVTPIISFSRGLGQLTDAIFQQVQSCTSLHTTVAKLTRKENQWEITTLTGERIAAETIVSCLPAYQLGKLVAQEHPSATETFSMVAYPPITVVHTWVQRECIRHLLDGFGALNNALESFHTLGTIFSSSLFPERCPPGQALLTTFVGGGLFPQKAGLPETILLNQVCSDLQKLLDWNGESIHQEVTRWKQAIPSMDGNLLRAREILPFLETRNLFTGGNWVNGVSVPDCIHSANIIADKLLA
ncbi:MAG: protoporphyrinogen oxidase [Bacteroidia bacterium]|nr:protoporphyrinogen oxidase [Bacteroidia bacterium]